MTDLEIFSKELREVLRSLNDIDYFLDNRLPDGLVVTDLEELQADLQRLCGFIDCMVRFNIPLAPEPF